MRARFLPSRGDGLRSAHPGKSDSVHDVRIEEYVDVDVGSMSDDWSEPGLRTNLRQDHGVTRTNGRRKKTGPKKRAEAVHNVK